MQIYRPEWYTGNVPWLLATRAARSFSQALLVIIVPLCVSDSSFSVSVLDGKNFGLLQTRLGAYSRSLLPCPSIHPGPVGTVLFMAAMALSPTFLLASVAFTVRIMINSIGMPIRQSFVMGVAEEESRSRVAAIGSLPSQATGMIAPTIASHLVQSVSEAAPIWLATVALAVNAGLFQLFFKNVRPPEEE